MKKYAIYSLCVFASACSFGAKPTCVPIERPVLNIKDPAPLKLNSVKFKVLHKDNSSEYFDSLAANKNSVVFALTETDYKNLAIDMEKLKGYIKAQKKILQTYRNYYEGIENGKDSKKQEIKK